ncbi:MAG: hypothetical protein AAF530_07315 [Pseudomonadota bacterium]
MKLGALILGILAGLGLLLYGSFGFALGDLATAMGERETGTLLKVVGIGLPIVALLGAGLVMKNAKLGGLLMIASGIGVLLFLGTHGFSWYLTVPLFIAGGLAFFAGKEQYGQTSPHGRG